LVGQLGRSRYSLVCTIYRLTETTYILTNLTSGPNAINNLIYCTAIFSGRTGSEFCLAKAGGAELLGGEVR
jgi:hypothetical protein